MHRQKHTTTSRSMAEHLSFPWLPPTNGLINESDLCQCGADTLKQETLPSLAIGRLLRSNGDPFLNLTAVTNSAPRFCGMCFF